MQQRTGLTVVDGNADGLDIKSVAVVRSTAVQRYDAFVADGGALVGGTWRPGRTVFTGLDGK